MNDTGSPVRRILIVGGGSSGWMSAAYLATQLRAAGGEVTLVESKTVPIIGVGEATVPPLVGYLRVLGISEDEFMRRAHATYKLGIKFFGWHDGRDAFWHPFGPVGGNIDGMQLFHYWLKCLRSGEDVGDFCSYSMQATAGDQGKAVRAWNGRSAMHDRGQYAYHLDAHAFAEFLREEATARGARHVMDDVVHVDVDEQGCIRQVVTREHGALTADLYIDCTGFRALLAEGALGDGYVDWSDALVCDRALALPLPHRGVLPPYTRSTALPSGWAWQIPLTHRMGNGYVYCSRYASEEQALREFATYLQADPERLEPRLLRMRVGHRKRFWQGNCIAVGLASGFLEPLESTGIFLVQRALALLLTYFPDSRYAPDLARRYNERMRETYEESRDFILAHYVLSRRDDTPFWRDYRAAALPETLRSTLEMYRDTGIVEPVQHAVFPEASWYAILAGQRCLPRTHHSGADLSDFGKVRAIMRAIREQNAQYCAALPAHEAYIAALNQSRERRVHETETTVFESAMRGL